MIKKQNIIYNNWKKFYILLCNKHFLFAQYTDEELNSNTIEQLELEQIKFRQQQQQKEIMN